MPVNVLGLNDTVTPLGSPDANKVTLPVKPYRRLRSDPATNGRARAHRDISDELIVKVGAATVKFKVVVLRQRPRCAGDRKRI